ncbi:unnamed protein product [Caenorhabditis auriculariae]|uniref:Nucleoside transporter n=1 Tax=Caenorhabditis auriculariae TaxID=2777116 RepID=A0A8S1HSP9_9PELO|nr:unnamed protein product [Caenorhabditis auriculariae]
MDSVTTITEKETEEAEEKNSWGRSFSAPKDSYYLVYLIFLLHGVGMLMSWNMFITIAPQYYQDYWFTVDGNATSYANSFMSIIGVTSQIPNVGVMIVNTFAVVIGWMMLRIVAPLIVNCFLIALIVAFVIFVTPNDNDRGWFYAVTLTIVMLMNLANGIYQNSVYGIVADFPDNYINSLIIGNNLCGVFTSLMSILTTLASPNDVQLNALLYFSISLFVMIVCLVSLYVLVKLPFYHHHMALGLEARLADESENPSVGQFFQCFKYCWVQLFNNFYVYFKYAKDHSVLPDDLYYGINTFLNFNLFAWIGSTAANYVQIPSAKFLWIPVVLRTLFIPFFMFCNYRPDGQRKWPVFFESEWWFTFGCSVMALTCGYFSSLALIYTPSGVPSSYQKLSGMLASIFLMLGILCGVASTPIAAWMVKTW